MDWKLIAICLLILLLLSSFRQSYVSGKFSKRQFAFSIAFVLCLAFLPMAFFSVWRDGAVIAKAEFNPGVAPFTVEVKKVPVPLTHSKHFIVSLYRGQYVVTSYRFFWPDYTPKNVKIDWPCMNHFTVTFDDLYKAECEWSWGKGAAWSIRSPEGHPKPGLGEYYFKPRKPVPQGCPVPNT